MAKHSEASRDDVLYAFAMDHETGGSSPLARYLKDYPQFAIDLVEFSRELSREVSDEPLDAEELAYLDGKMGRLRESAVTLSNLQAAPTRLFTEAATALGLPLQVGLALRERRIEVASLPGRLLEKLAQALHASATTVHSFLSMPAQVSTLRANKSNNKPGPALKVPLERLLADAGMDEARITALLHGDE